MRWERSPSRAYDRSSVATRGRSAIAATADRGRHQFCCSAPPTPQCDPIITYAAHCLRAAAERQSTWPGGGYSDPCWRLLLDLLVQEHAGRDVSTSSACIASGAPSTTALRMIKAMTDAGHLIKEPDPSDDRRVFVRLSAHARERIIAQLQREVERARIAVCR